MTEVERLPELPDVTDASFQQEVLDSKLPVLVDFWGDHCAACRQIAPVLGEIAGEHADDLKVVKVHAAENVATSSRFGIRAMPTVLVFCEGEVRGQLVGAQPKSAFLELVEQAR